MIVIKENNTIYISYTYHINMYTNVSDNTLKHEDNLMTCRLFHHPDTYLIVQDYTHVRDFFKYELKLPDEVNILSIQQEVIPQMKSLLDFYNIPHKQQLSGSYILIHDHKIYSISNYQFVKEIETFEVLGFHSEYIRLILTMYQDLSVEDRIEKVYDFLRRAYKILVPDYDIITIGP